MTYLESLNNLNLVLHKDSSGNDPINLIKFKSDFSQYDNHLFIIPDSQKTQ